MTGYLLFGIAYAFAAAVQPGPFQTYLISQTLAVGWKRTLPAAFAPLLSDGPIAVVILSVLSQVPEWFAGLLQLMGGLFLFYLAAAAYGAWRRYDPEKPAQPKSGAQSLFKATAVNLLNPNPYMGWSLVMGPKLLQGWRESPVDGAGLLVGFYGTLVAITMGIIVLFGAARTLGPRVSRALLGLSVIALGCFGVYELWMGGRGLAR